MTSIFQGSWHRLLEFAALARAQGSEVDAEGHHSARAALESSIAGIMDPLHGECYAGIVAASLDGPLVIAQIGQSLDGRIATASGHSHYINGPEALDHLHHLRALVDAVIIGASTAVLDDPSLTTRRVEGPDPVRVVIDPTGRVPRAGKVFGDDGAPGLVVTVPGGGAESDSGPERIELAADNGSIPPQAVLGALRARGLNTVLVEGGAITVSRFLAAGAIDRLHVLVAPLILGSGRQGLELPKIDRVDQGHRPATRVHQLGSDVLFDCDLRRSITLK
jgi:diaminohydroxyphosphoribosylaminopyrimidine deaminase / 5-amino-6-(5-phosphoribosylamino)uracil reductase